VRPHREGAPASKSARKPVPAKIPRPSIQSVFPPRPARLRGRTRELSALAAAVLASHPSRIALIGAGGSGKSTLACALGHRLAPEFPGGIHWFRVGAWESPALVGMLALRFRVERHRALPALRRRLVSLGEALIVLDNHENDAATAALLDALRSAPITWVITARRCLMAGVSIFPVVPPLATQNRDPFPAVASLTRLLRWNPVGLEIASAAVETGAASAEELRRFLLGRGVDRVRVIEHEDDLPEVALMVAWAWGKLPVEARRMLAVLTHAGGDHMDEGSLCELAGVGGGDRGAEGLGWLRRLKLVQEPLSGRLALHATVRHALARRTRFSAARLFEHYVSLLERSPDRLDLEQTHLFAAMDFAHDTGDLRSAMRVQELVSKLGV
jgi:hypothetical protein